MTPDPVPSHEGQWPKPRAPWTIYGTYVARAFARLNTKEERNGC